MSILPNKVRQHLQEFGLKFGLSPQSIDKRLERVMGPQRFRCYLSVLEDCRVTGRSISEVYNLFGSLEEANLAMSHQSDLTLKIASWILS